MAVLLTVPDLHHTKHTTMPYISAHRDSTTTACMYARMYVRMCPCMYAKKEKIVLFNDASRAH